MSQRAKCKQTCVWNIPIWRACQVDGFKTGYLEWFHANIAEQMVSCKYCWTKLCQDGTMQTIFEQIVSRHSQSTQTNQRLIK